MEQNLEEKLQRQMADLARLDTQGTTVDALQAAVDNLSKQMESKVNELSERVTAELQTGGAVDDLSKQMESKVKEVSESLTEELEFKEALSELETKEHE